MAKGGRVAIPRFMTSERASDTSSVSLYWTPALVMLLGILSVALLFWLGHVSEQQAVQRLVVDEVISDLEVALATSHLWLEEHLTGDQSIEIDDVWRDLDRAVDLSSLILNGGEVERGLRVAPLEDPQLREYVQNMKVLLVEFRSTSVERYRQGTSALAGTAIDQSFDQTFLKLLQDAKGLRSRFADRALRFQDGSRWRLRMVGAGWSLIVAAAVFGLWSRERRRRRAEETLRLREAELLQAQKMDAVGRLAGGIAHDINNYLGALRGYCEVAKLKNERGKALADRMDAAIETATEASVLIRKLLAFSRKQPIHTEVLGLNLAVHKMKDLTSQLIGEDISIVLDCQSDLWHVEADPSQVEQVLINLLVNARDALPQGGEIRVSTRNVEVVDEVLAGDVSVPPGRYVRLTVTDNGVGIPEEVRDQIFEPFFSTKPESSSSGLGLATVYGIVQQNGGTITVISETGEGASFEIHWRATHRSLEEPTGPQDLGLSLDGPKAKILLVEDNANMRAATHELLEALGHEVLVASDGPDAVFRIRREEDSIDLLLTDVVMPGMSGPELLERLRSEGYDIRCLFMSGYTDSVILQHDLDQDDVDFLSKPFKTEELVQKIRDVLTPATDPSHP